MSTSMSTSQKPISEWRTCFMGSPELAIPALKILQQHTNCELVVTQPDRRAGRGGKMRSPPVKVAADELNIPTWQPETLRGAENDERLQNFDLFVVLAYGEILRQPVLDLPAIECINLHASLLPRWRGASPLQAVLRAGDNETGVSVMRMVRALDAGPVFHQLRFPVASDATLPWLHDTIADKSAQALEQFFELWKSTGLIDPVAQDEEAVTVCGKLLPEDGQIDWQQSAVEIERLVRAYTPAPGCSTQADGERYRIHQVVVVDDMLLSPGKPTCVTGNCLSAAVRGR